MKKRRWTTFLLLFIFFLGLSIMLYPALSNYWNSKTQSQAINDYEAMLKAMNDEDYTEYFNAAAEYNKALASLDFPLKEYGKIKGYNEILSLNSSGMMGYVSISKIGIELPLYHGTSQEVLNVAIGHLQGSSFPIGGESTHAVVSAHRGLPGAKLFTDLDRLEIGDTFTVTILNQTLAYQVDQIRIVQPNDASEMAIIEGGEHCTLLTCTPYGVNTERLLVRGTRVDTIEHRTIYVSTDAYQIDTLIVTPIVALPILFVLMMIVLFKPVKKDEGDD
ncbi:MAG: class C sortase [Ruminococcaceae bacterium]|nr:class C sortase [Oscillospiraceae bacterium]